MEINEFIEQDILVFLDERLDKAEAATAMRKASFTSTVFIIRDYEKELNAALDKQDLVEAKKVLAALKQQFDECPTGTQDKQQLKALLIMLYDRFKDQLDVQNSFANLDTRARPTQTPPPAAQQSPSASAPPTPSPASVPPTSTDAPTAPASATTPNVPITPAFPSAPAPPVTPSPPPLPTRAPIANAPSTSPTPQPETEDYQHLLMLLDAIDVRLAKGDIKAAVGAYRTAKEAAIRLGTLPLQLSLRYLTVYGRIKQVLLNVKKGNDMTLPLMPEKFAGTAMDQQLLLQLEAEKHTLDALLKQNDIAGSMDQYKKMRLLAQQLHDPLAASTTKEKLGHIYSLIEQLRKHPSLDESKLVAVP